MTRLPPDDVRELSKVIADDRRRPGSYPSPLEIRQVVVHDLNPIDEEILIKSHDSGSPFSIRTLHSYAPAIGDVAWMLRQGSDNILLGKIGGAFSGATYIEVDYYESTGGWVEMTINSGEIPLGWWLFIADIKASGMSPPASGYPNSLYPGVSLLLETSVGGDLAAPAFGHWFPSGVDDDGEGEATASVPVWMIGGFFGYTVNATAQVRGTPGGSEIGIQYHLRGYRVGDVPSA